MKRISLLNQMTRIFLCLFFWSSAIHAKAPKNSPKVKSNSDFQRLIVANDKLRTAIIQLMKTSLKSGLDPRDLKEVFASQKTNPSKTPKKRAQKAGYIFAESFHNGIVMREGSRFHSIEFGKVFPVLELTVNQNLFKFHLNDKKSLENDLAKWKQAYASASNSKSYLFGLNSLPLFLTNFQNVFAAKSSDFIGMRFAQSIIAEVIGETGKILQEERERSIVKAELNEKSRNIQSAMDKLKSAEQKVEDLQKKLAENLSSESTINSGLNNSIANEKFEAASLDAYQPTLNYLVNFLNENKNVEFSTCQAYQKDSGNGSAHHLKAVTSIPMPITVRQRDSGDTEIKEYALGKNTVVKVNYSKKAKQTSENRRTSDGGFESKTNVDPIEGKIKSIEVCNSDKSCQTHDLSETPHESAIKVLGAILQDQVAQGYQNGQTLNSVDTSETLSIYKQYADECFANIEMQSAKSILNYGNVADNLKFFDHPLLKSWLVLNCKKEELNSYLAEIWNESRKLGEKVYEAAGQNFCQKRAAEFFNENSERIAKAPGEYFTCSESLNNHAGFAAAAVALNNEVATFNKKPYDRNSFENVKRTYINYLQKSENPEIQASSDPKIVKIRSQMAGMINQIKPMLQNINRDLVQSAEFIAASDMQEKCCSNMTCGKELDKAMTSIGKEPAPRAGARE